MRPGIDSYSYHRYFGEVRPGEVPTERVWSTWDFLDRASALDVSGVGLETCFLERPDDDGFWIDLASTCRDLGLDVVLSWGHPTGLSLGRDMPAFADMLNAIDRTAECEWDLTRVVMGTFVHWASEPTERSLDRLAPLMAQAARHAELAGVELAIETHCDLPSRSLLELLDRVGSERLGVVLDTANVVRVGEDPLETTRLVAPHTRMLHLKDLDLSQADIGDPGGWWPCVALGDGDLAVDDCLADLMDEGQVDLACVEIGAVDPMADEDAMVSRSLAWLASRIQ